MAVVKHEYPQFQASKYNTPVPLHPFELTRSRYGVHTVCTLRITERVQKPLEFEDKIHFHLLLLPLGPGVQGEGTGEGEKEYHEQGPEHPIP